MFNEKKAMINTSKLFKTLCIGLAVPAFLLVCVATATAQRDPFAKPGYQRERKPAPVNPLKGNGMLGAAPVNYGPPPIEARIDYFKRLRETAAANGAPLPKVTSVLTLGEMAVTGIFKTPRGYAAMVEATPIKLSYTIYPGEKFFDGQLVAVEENRLVFRKVTKTGAGKFVASVENKPLRQFSMKAEVEGTAPVQGEKQTVQLAKNDPAPAGPVIPETPANEKRAAAKPKKEAKPSNPFLSPLDEMNNMPQQPATDEKTKKAPKKPVKVAKNGGNK
jgi:hypothetical protein